MNDRELLELAAKAAGVNGFLVDVGLNIGSNAFPKVWNPLTDDGDALRLAVRLDLSVHINGPYSATAEVFKCGEPIILRKEYCCDETKYAATRRAIVRAAAEIGKAMQ
jgi:hypothetical protein